MTQENSFKYYGAAVLALIFIVWGIYTLLFSRLGVTLYYDAVYGKMFLYVAVAAVLFYIVDWTKIDGDNSFFQSTFFIAEEDEFRPLSSSWWLPVTVSLLVGALVFLVIFSSGFSLYGVPNATGSSLSYSTEELSQASTGTYFLSAVIPGILEQFLIFAIITLLSGFLTAVTATIQGKDIQESVGVRWFWIIVLTLGTSVLFAFAHKQFDGNQAMSLWAIVFQFIVSMLDQAGGVFVSWIPHVLHNSGVVASKTLSIAPLGAFMTFMIAYPRREKIRAWLSRWKRERT